MAPMDSQIKANARAPGEILHLIAGIERPKTIAGCGV